jgi:peptidoglycan/xylan/chitin deacetylase (PgdA/CDA1 family)
MLLVVAISSCTAPTKDNNTKVEPSITPVVEEAPNQEQSEQGDIKEKDKPIEREIDIKKIKANENGKIMILMYHGISDKEGEWVRTPDNFRRDLQTLYDNGYRAISLRDFVTNNISVEAGYTPVVFTFDDGLKNQFNYIEENGNRIIDPQCAVGILEDFYKKHPDFGRAASFYVFYPLPFRQKELIKEKYEFLINNGYEIGNHSYTHENLGKISTSEVQKALALNVVNTLKYINDYEVFSLALPYGAAPKDDNYKYVVSGEYDGQSYKHKAVLKVGSNPAVAPNNKKFDATKLPRVRASEMNTAGTGLYDWLKHFEKNPNERYISDGDPNSIAIPEGELESINQDSIKDKKVITY